VTHPAAGGEEETGVVNAVETLPTPSTHTAAARGFAPKHYAEEGERDVTGKRTGRPRHLPAKTILKTSAATIGEKDERRK
jgi:hypothetical protein